MEYSVSDLLKILLRRWYIIILTMALLEGLSVFTSRASYQQAAADYAAYTTQTEPILSRVGTMTATGTCSYSIIDFSRQQEAFSSFYESYLQSLSEDVFDTTEKLDPTDFIMDAYSSSYQSMQKLLVDSTVISLVNAKFSGYEEPLQPGTPLTVFDHITVELIDTNALHMTATDLPEDIAQSAWNFYLEIIHSVGAEFFNLSVEVTDISIHYIENPPEYTQAALLAQTVMQKPPEAPPSIVRTTGTAAVCGFVLACFGLLLVTFIRDSRRLQKELTAHEAS